MKINSFQVLSDIMMNSLPCIHSPSTVPCAFDATFTFALFSLIHTADGVEEEVKMWWGEGRRLGESIKQSRARWDYLSTLILCSGLPA